MNSTYMNEYATYEITIRRRKKEVFMIGRHHLYSKTHYNMFPNSRLRRQGEILEFLCQLTQFEGHSLYYVISHLIKPQTR